MKKLISLFWFCLLLAGAASAQTGRNNLNYACAPQFSTTDTLNNSTLTSEQFFATSCQIPANSFYAHRTLRVWLGSDTTYGATTTWVFRVKLCTVSGCGSGTVVTLYQNSATAPTNAFSAVGGGVEFLIQGTAAPGASVAIEQSFMINPQTASASVPYSHNTIASSVSAVPTNSAMFLQFSIQFSGATGTHSMTLTQLVTEWLN